MLLMPLGTQTSNTAKAVSVDDEDKIKEMVPTAQNGWFIQSQRKKRKVFLKTLKQERMNLNSFFDFNDPHGNITRINNALDNLPRILENSQSQLEALQTQLETAKGELGVPFSHEGELTTKIARLTELNIMLNIEGQRDVATNSPPVAVVPGETSIAAEKPPAVINRVADKPPIPTAIAPDVRIADKSPKSIYGKMEYYRDRDNPPKETDSRNPKSRNDTEL